MEVGQSNRGGEGWGDAAVVRRSPDFREVILMQLSQVSQFDWEA